MMRRDQSIIALRAMGLTVKQIAARLKLSDRAVYMALRRVQPAQEVIVDELKRDPVTAELILTRLSDMFNADIGDIIEPRLVECAPCSSQAEVFCCLKCRDTGEMANPKAGSYRPIHDWPAVWRRMLSGSEIKELFEHSKDGEGASWDKIGELVKIKFIDPLKLLELAMRHKGVDAMVKQGDTNIVIITPEQQRQARLKRAQQRLNEAINVTPEKDA